MTVTNSGTLDVDAVTANGGTASAIGVLPVGALATGTFTFINDGGTIQVRQSTDGGATWHRGMAVDVTGTPNPAVINLVGNGSIYGNVAVKTGDTVNVASGTTYFNGIINPSLVPVGGFTTADLDTGISGPGTLNINAGGNLVLADPRITGPANMYDGPAYAIVDTLNIDAAGTLTYELQPAAGGAQPVGTYPQIYTDTANLDGTLVADLHPAGGLFADSYFWDNVIDANTRNGTFTSCKLGGAYANSLLLSFGCVYDANDNVDLSLTRNAFNSVAGLNANALGVAVGLTSYYSTSLTGGAANLFGDLFLFTDAANYNIALNELSGSVYANYLNSFPIAGCSRERPHRPCDQLRDPGACRLGSRVPVILADPRLGSARLSDA